MKTVKLIDFLNLALADKAHFLGRVVKDFAIVSEKVSDQGVIEVVWTYTDWDFNITYLIVPILDSGYCQVVEVK